MGTEILLTQEVGSLAKPDWRVKTIAGTQLGEKDVEQASSWGKRLQIDADPLIALLEEYSRLDEPCSDEMKKQIRHWSSLYAVRLQEHAGLDIIYDGEQNRSEMYEHAVRRSQGFESRGLVRAFDNKYYQKFAAVEEPRVATLWHVDELLKIQKLTEKPIKVPITGAYTIAAWSFDEHYKKPPAADKSADVFQRETAARRNFIVDIAKKLIRPNIEALIANGARMIQIDEPAATTIPSEVPLFIEAFNESTRELDCEFSVHICFSDYSLLFPYITEMENCSQYSLEFANRDSRNLGTRSEDRPAYDDLKLFKKYNIPSRIGLGVSDIHSDFIESPELVRDRILYAAKILGDPALINPSPDCGLRTRTWDVAFAKLNSVVEGSRLAEQLL